MFRRNALNRPSNRSRHQDASSFFSFHDFMRTYAEEEQIQTLLDDHRALHTIVSASAARTTTTTSGSETASSGALDSPRPVSASLAVARLSSFGPIHSRPVRSDSIIMDTEHSPMVTTVFISTPEMDNSTLLPPPLPPPPLQFATGASFGEHVINNYSVHVPPPTHFAGPSTLNAQLLQVRPYDSPHRIMDQQQLLAQQIEQYRQKQFELDCQNPLFDQLEVNVSSPALSGLNPLSSQNQPPSHSASSLLLRTALSSQSNMNHNYSDAVQLVSTNFTSHTPVSQSNHHSPVSDHSNSSTLFVSDSPSNSLPPHESVKQCDDREEVESGVGRSDTCSEGLDSLCNRSCSASSSADNASGCTDRAGRSSADSALRITLNDSPVKDNSDTFITSDAPDSNAYAFCARRPDELTNCTHQIKFTKTPGFSCLSCLLLLLSLLLLAVFLSSAIFFVLRSADPRSSNERLFKGQFLATQGIKADVELLHRKGSQYQRLASDIRSRLDHLLNTSRWSGRFVRSELVQVEPIVNKEKRNLNPMHSALTRNESRVQPWLDTVEQHLLYSVSANDSNVIDHHQLVKMNSDIAVSPDMVGTHWLHFRLFFTDVPVSQDPARPIQPGPSASDLYLLLSEELIRSTSSLFSRYSIPQSSLTIAERVPTTSPFVQLQALWQWIRSPTRHWPIRAIFSRTIQQKSIGSSLETVKMAAVHSPARFDFSPSTISSNLQHFSDGSSVQSYSSSAVSSSSASSSFCAPIHLTFCDHLPYGRSSYPNLLGHSNQSDLDRDLLSYRQMIDAECDPSSRLLLCALLQPPCSDSNTEPHKADSHKLWLPMHSSTTRISNQRNRICSRYLERVLDACSEWTPEPVQRLLAKVVQSPLLTLVHHSDLICAQGESECVAKLRAQGQHKLLCDHVTDCHDGSDEQFCEPIACAPQPNQSLSSSFASSNTMYRRQNQSNNEWFDCGTRCLPINERCDQSIQCDNAQDELDCVRFDQESDSIVQHSNAVRAGSTSKPTSGHPKVMLSNREHIVCADFNVNQTANLPEISNQLCRQMHFGHADSFAVEPRESSQTRFVNVQLIDFKLRWSASECSTGKVLRITCSPAICGQTSLIHQPPAWVIQRRSWSMDSNLIAFSAALHDWPWFGQLTLHDQFLCDVSLVNSYTAVVSSRCLIRWNQATSDPMHSSSPDASTLAVRFGLVRGGSRQPPAQLQAKVTQVRQDQIVSWLHLSAIDCDQVVVEESRCVRPPLSFVCLPSSVSFGAQLSNDSPVSRSKSSIVSTSTESIHFEGSACFLVYTDLAEERTLFMAATTLSAQHCKAPFDRNITKGHRALPVGSMTGNHSLCVKSLIQHEENRKHDDSIGQLQQRLAQQPGSPLYCYSSASGWTLAGLMRRPLTFRSHSKHTSELYFEFDRIANHDVQT